MFDPGFCRTPYFTRPNPAPISTRSGATDEFAPLVFAHDLPPVPFAPPPDVKGVAFFVLGFVAPTAATHDWFGGVLGLDFGLVRVLGGVGFGDEGR